MSKINKETLDLKNLFRKRRNLEKEINFLIISKKFEKTKQKLQEKEKINTKIKEILNNK